MKHRLVDYSILQSQSPYLNAGLSGTLELTPEWFNVRRTFVVDRDGRTSRLNLDIGGSNETIEIADDLILRELTGQESAAELVRPRWKLSAPASAGAVAIESAKSLSVRVKNPPDDDLWKIQLQCGGLAIKAGEKYTFELQARSTGARPLQYALTQGREPWGNLGLWGETTLSEEIQVIRQSFVATHGDNSGRLTLAIGASEHDVVVEDVHLFQKDLELLSPLTLLH